MAKVLQHRRDTTANLSSVSGAIGEFFMDTTKNTLVVMDGSTNGGHPLALESDLVSNLGDLSNVTLTTPSNGQVLKYNGSIWVNSSDAGIGLSDLSVTTNSAGSAALSYDNTTGAFSYTPPDLSSYVTSSSLTSTLSSYATTASLSSYQTTSGLNSAIDSHLNQSNPTNGYVLSWDATVGDYAWVSNAGYTNSDVDSHLNTSSATANYVLSWNGSDYAWVAQASGADGNTQYTMQADTTTGGANLTLVGNDASTDSVKLAAGSNITITRSDASTITIASTASGGSADFSAVPEDVLPSFDSVYDLGSPSLQWYDAFLSNSLVVGSSVVVGNSSMTTGSVVVGGATLIGNTTGLVTDTVLIGDILHTTNTLTPDASTALQYAGDQGVVDINGNLDVSTGDWILPGIVETTEVATTSVSSEEQILGSTVRLNVGIASLYTNFNVYDFGQNIQLNLSAFKTEALAYAFIEKAKAAGSLVLDSWVSTLRGVDGSTVNRWFGDDAPYTITINADAEYVVQTDNYGYRVIITSVSSTELSAAYAAVFDAGGIRIQYFAGEAKSLVLDVSTTSSSTVAPLTTGIEGSIRYNKDETELQLYTTTWNKVPLVSDIPPASPNVNLITDDNIDQLTQYTPGEVYMLSFATDQSSKTIPIPDGTVVGQSITIYLSFAGSSNYPSFSGNITGNLTNIDDNKDVHLFVWAGSSWKVSD